MHFNEKSRFLSAPWRNSCFLSRISFHFHFRNSWRKHNNSRRVEHALGRKKTILC